MAKTWMAGTSPAMTDGDERKKKTGLAAGLFILG